MVASIQSIDKTSPVRKQALNGSQQVADSTDFDKLELIMSLQSHLDLEQLLQHFLESVNTLLRVDGIFFQEENREIKLKLGKQSVHSCGYRLVNGSSSYGELVFKRSKRFSETELELIEDMMILLLIPIGNALKYADAVRQAIQDPATNVGNRTAMEKTLNREIELAKRHNHPLSLMTINLDSSTQKKTIKLPVNVVTTLIDIIQNVSRCTDILFRIGEREFRLIMHSDAKGTQPIARRIEKAIKRAFNHSDAYGLTVSTGIATLTGTDSMKSLIERIKNQFRNR